jgi:hypothetical protein
MSMELTADTSATVAPDRPEKIFTQPPLRPGLPDPAYHHQGQVDELVHPPVSIRALPE